jgi:DNA-binding NarL/FixJ family response regulator
MLDETKEHLQLVADGWSNTAIAEKLDISPKAVEAQLTRVYRALDPQRAPTTASRRCSRSSSRR